MQTGFLKVALGAAAMTVLAVGSQASAQVSAFVYDTTAGATTVYAGDLTSGTLSLDSIDGRSFRAQRVGVQAELGEFGEGVGAGASLAATMSLDSFFDSGSPTGDGDIAFFSGMGGVDFLVTDEFGETLSGSIAEFVLVDRSDAFKPGIEGQGRITDLVFSAPTFQGVSTSDLVDEGTIFTFSFLIAGVNLETYLASDGLGNLPVEVETVEARIEGIPLPATTGLAFAGLVPFGVATMRRRR